MAEPNTRSRLLRLLAIMLISVSPFAACEDSGVPEFEHVFVVVEENQGYEQVVGNTTDMPYLNSLIRGYGLATNYYANAHPSINDYFFLTAGHPGVSDFWGSDNLLADHRGPVSGENIASILTENGKTWKAYLEGLPSPGSLVPSHGAYVKRHNPFAYFTTVVRGTTKHPSEASNLVPFEAYFQRDLQNGTLPNYSFIVPDIYDDGHNNRDTRKPAGCDDHIALQQIDHWLSGNIRPLISAPDFQRSGLLIILFDEACDQDKRLDPSQPSLRGGGHIPALIISSKTAPGTTSKQLFHHQSALRLSLQALGIQKFPGAAANAADMGEFFRER